jgi:hypothetical protein
MTEIRDYYLQTWNATDPAARRALLQQHWSTSAVYVDSLVDVTGHDSLDATIAAVQAQFPGLVFTPLGEVDAHHGVARFQWGLGPAGSESVAIGFDVVTTDADGRITQALGFLDKTPA